MRRGVLHDACAAIGRDPAEITTSALIRYTGNIEELIHAVEEWEDVGLDLGMIALPKTEAPEMVEEIADALA
jgi:hypothetical protein